MSNHVRNFFSRSSWGARLRSVDNTQYPRSYATPLSAACAVTESTFVSVRARARSRAPYKCVAKQDCIRVIAPLTGSYISGATKIIPASVRTPRTYVRTHSRTLRVRACVCLVLRSPWILNYCRVAPRETRGRETRARARATESEFSQ